MMTTTLPLRNLGDDIYMKFIKPNYGFCVLVAVSSVGVLAWKSAKVEQARKLYGVPHPKMYSDENDHFNDFNCIQRAYQDTIEKYPQFLTLLLLGGLESPGWCATGGAVYLIGRIAYAQGYYTGDPKKRTWGLFGHAGFFMMLGSTLKLAFKLLCCSLV